MTRSTRRPGTRRLVLALATCGLASTGGAGVAPPAAGASGARDPGTAARALAATFPELAQRPSAPSVPDGTVVEDYIGVDAARVSDAAGRRGIVLSSAPLRSRVGQGGLRPLALDLVEGAPGELRPANPATQVRLATTATGGFTIGPDPDHLLTVVPLDVDPGVRPAAVFAGQVLFAGARPDADLLLRPAADGVSTYEQLAGPGAPESFAYRLALRPGQTADLADGIVTVRQGGRVIARALPPMALDADRREVPVTETLEGDVLRLDVPHRAGAFRYPIAVDPDWVSSYDYAGTPGLGLQGWLTSSSPTPPPGQDPYYDTFINNVYDPVNDPAGDALGLFVRPRVPGAARVFPAGSAGLLFFNAPGTTHIRRVAFTGVHRFNDRDRQTLRLGLYGGAPDDPNAFKDSDDVFAAQVLSQDDVVLPHVPFPADRDTPAKTAVMWMFTSPCSIGTDPNCPPVIDHDSLTLMRVGSVQLTLTDFDTPTTTLDGTLRELQDRWTNAAGTRTLVPTADDAGSGIRSLTVTSQDAAGSHLVRQVQSPCNEQHTQTSPPQGASICPAPLGLDQPLELDVGAFPEGRSTLVADAADPAGNTAVAGGGAAAVSVYLDRRPPVTSVAGELFDGRDRWRRPERPVTVTVTGTDTDGGQGNTSGVAHNHLTATDEDGTTVVDQDADTCTPPPAAPTPCEPGRASRFTVDPRTLPEGPVTFAATTSDLATNDSTPVTWTVRIDRTPPAARATGDLVRLSGAHTNSTSPTTVTLHGRDAASGVARLQLVARSRDGEQVLADVDTCPDDARDADAACPHTPSVEATVQPADLPDGQTTFVARAIDAAGLQSDDAQDWDTYVDHTPPDPPDRVLVMATSSTSVMVTWPPAVDKPEGSGSVSYEYLVVAGGVPVGTWRPTVAPFAQAAGLPAGVTVKVLVRAIDEARNVSTQVAGQVALLRTTAPSAIEIRKGLGLDALERQVVAEAERITLRAAEAATFRSALRSLGKFVGRASVVGFLASIGLEDGDLDCEQGPLYRYARQRFAIAGDALARVARAGTGPHPVAVRRVGEARTAMDEVRRYVAGNGVVKECEGPNKVARRTSDVLDQRLDQAALRIEEQEVLPDYFDKNGVESQRRGFPSETKARIGYRTCRRLRSKDNCRSIPTLFPGADTPLTTEHIRFALFSAGKPELLHYAAKEDRAREGWYRLAPECLGKTGQGTGKDCDEYPVRASVEGGPGAHLRPVPSADNQLAGSRAGGFYRVCGVNSPGRNFLVIPLPSEGISIDTVYACNGRR